MQSCDPKRQLTVLFIFHDCDFYSGATRSLLDMIDKYLVDKSVNLVALFPGIQGTAVDYLKNKGVKIISSYYPWVIASIKEPWIIKRLAFPYRLLRYYFSVYKTYKLKDAIKHLKIDLVYTNTSTICVGGLINRFFKVPHIWHFREFVEEDHQYEYFLGRKKFYRFAYKYSDEIVIISEKMYQKYSRHIPEGKLKIIYDDVSPKYINPKSHFASNEKLELLIAGTLCETKGQYEVLQAISVLAKKGYDITLNIAGKMGSNYFRFLSDYVSRNQLNNHVVFHGLVKNMNKLRENMDIGIVASHFEAFGRVTVEGMLSSMAMIGRDSGATSELIQDGKTGLLYEPNNIEDLVNKIEYLCNNRTEIKRLALNGYQYARDNFTAGNCSDSLLDTMWGLIQ